MVVTTLASPLHMHITNVYAPTDHALKQTFLDETISLAPPTHIPWLLLGDFNLMRHAHDKNNAAFRQNEADLFNQTIILLLELPLLDRAFTWSNKHDRSARSWLDGLPPNSIHSWADFEHAFLNNFEGTYQRPGSGVDLHNIIQGDNESVHDFVARWLKKKNTLTTISNETAIEAFVNDAQDVFFHHKLGWKRGEGKLSTMSALMKVANDSGEETAMAGRRPIKITEIAEPAGGDGPEAETDTAIEITNARMVRIQS